MLAIPKELKIQGFIVTSFYAKINEAITDLSGWIKEVILFTILQCSYRKDIFFL